MSNLLQQALLKTAAPEPDPRDTANILRHNEAILSYRRGTAKSNFDTLGNFASNCPNCNWSPSWWTICAPTWCVISESPYIGSKQSHILKVPHRKALRLRHPGLQIGTDALHELGTPRLNLLKAHNVRARRPIELQHLDIDCRSGLDLALPIPPRNRADPSLVFFNVHDIHSPTSLNRTRQ